MKKIILSAGLFLVLVGLTIVVNLLRDSSIRHQVELLPKVLMIDSSQVLYSNSRSWGFGPGGNEVSVAAFLLPPKAKQLLTQEGIGAFKIDRSDPEERSSYFAQWHETPVEVSGWYLEDGERASVSRYLFQNGFGIELEKELEEEIDQLVNTSDSYYSSRAGSTLIVAPDVSKVYLILKG